MTNIFSDTEHWLSQRHKWLQDAASRLIKNNNKPSIEDLKELIELCKAEALLIDSDRVFKTIEPNSLSVKDTSINLRLNSIHNVQGISALGPRNPLTFNSPLSIIYGQNGSGKSSYVRLLKHISGATDAEKLEGNVFIQGDQSQKCSVSITTNEITSEILWSPELGPLNDLRTLQLYDTDCANVYVNEENEVAYEPWLLQFFSKLTNICIAVGKAIKLELDSITLTRLNPPEGISQTKSFKWFKAINELTSKDEIDKHCFWGETDEFNLNNKKQQIFEENPIKKMEHYNKIVASTKNCLSLLTGIRNSLSEEACTEIINAKLDSVTKKKVAEEDANKVFDGLPLEGVGSESWKLLWEQARLFSEYCAYPNEQFPFTSTDANCVLCHQPLSLKAQERLISFESFIKASLSKQAKAAEERFTSLSKSVKDIPKETVLELHFNLMGISIEEKAEITDFCKTLQNRSESLKNAISLKQLTPLPSEELLLALSEVAATNEQMASSYYDLSILNDRDEINNELLELEARKWLSQNKNLISDNIDKMNKINNLKKAYSLTNTQALSTKKSSLSDELITSAYIKRFEEELKELGGSKINVNLVKTRAAKGQIYHQIQLKNCLQDIRTSEVLSEGEFRIVSLAGFLADVEGNSDNTPFIFDDPISSLDQVFEEATIKRIAKLSLSRQVIVFTHRLSFLTLLEEAAKEMGIDFNVTCLRSESWGAGEPGETPIFARKPINSLNLLLNERLSRARKALQEDGRTEYDMLAKGICSDFRILLERFIEAELLADVVQRFRRSITTQGKIHKLARINNEDCKMFEDLLTKYSKYEHSQSYEMPVSLPEPDEIKEDMETIKNWVFEFKKRTI